MLTVAKYFSIFYIYSFLGWAMETTKNLIETKKFVNRGFLIGPYCPIYGFGIVAITALLTKYINDVPVMFCMSLLICGVLEYYTSLVMEKVFKARWWDYTNRKFNINGRVCLDVMLGFGLLALLVIYVLQPIVVNIVDLIPNNISYILAIILVIIYIADHAISCVLLVKIKGEIKNEKKDNTETIKKQIDKWVAQNSVLYRRITKAFPNFLIFKKINRKKDEK